jgi:predicted molibdopterin-dependent oxidoreductase YjgC|tara:strand:- start:2521 stop:2814 length:294 start_codon:yes stop_codon:yes gene_type:complete
MLKRLQKSQDKVVTFWFEKNPVQAQEGESVAAALLIAGVKYLRSAQVSAKPRMPYCWMGVCYECLLEIDGEQNQQSCLITVKDGMHVRRQLPAIEKI